MLVPSSILILMYPSSPHLDPQEFLAYKAHSLNKKQSLGMKLTEERLALMNAQEDKKFSLQITDKLGPEGEALGTLVRIEMEI